MAQIIQPRPEGGALVAGVGPEGGGSGGSTETGCRWRELLPVTEHHIHLEGHH